MLKLALYRLLDDIQIYKMAFFLSYILHCQNINKKKHKTARRVNIEHIKLKI